MAKKIKFLKAWRGSKVGDIVTCTSGRNEMLDYLLRGGFCEFMDASKPPEPKQKQQNPDLDDKPKKPLLRKRKKKTEQTGDGIRSQHVDQNVRTTPEPTAE